MTKSIKKQPDDAARDFELMALVKAGESDAFREIVARHQRGLVNFFRKLGIIDDAEDLAQDTFVRLYKYRDKYEPKAKFTTFLYMMARQVRMDHLRKVQRRGSLELELIEVSEQSENEAVGQAGSESRRPDVGALLNGLNEGMREVVVLSIYKGLKYAEISEITGLPVGTIKSRVFAAMRKMREMLSD